MKGKAQFPIIDGKKICNKCLVEKPISEFPKKERGDSYKADCKRCSVARSLAARAKKPEYYKERQKQYQKRVKLEALNAYGGPFCACCGESNVFFLTLDHINNDGAEHRKTMPAGSSTYRWLKNNGYPAGLRVLCYNCNCGRHANGGVCPHELEGATTIPQGSTAKRLEAPGTPMG